MEREKKSKKKHEQRRSAKFHPVRRENMTPREARVLRSGQGLHSKLFEASAVGERERAINFLTVFVTLTQSHKNEEHEEKTTHWGRTKKFRPCATVLRMKSLKFRLTAALLHHIARTPRLAIPLHEFRHRSRKSSSRSRP
jgi:hypothetical protein